MPESSNKIEVPYWIRKLTEMVTETGTYQDYKKESNTVNYKVAQKVDK